MAIQAAAGVVDTAVAQTAFAVAVAVAGGATAEGSTRSQATLAAADSWQTAERLLSEDSSALPLQIVDMVADTEETQAA